MHILVPFLILTSFSMFLNISYKIKLERTFLITSILIIFILLIFGKFGLLNLANEFLKYSSIGFFLYLLINKKISLKHTQSFVILLLFYIILIWVCKDLFYYKYDEFSEYGITTKLIFSENNLPSNIQYLQKGSHHKINFISYFHYFFLKNTTEIFIESITYIAHSIIIFSLLAAILNFIDINYLKKILIGLTFYFLIYALGPGIDRLYVDSIVALCVSLLLLIYFNKQTINSDHFIFFLLVTALPMVKPNGLLIILGLLIIFILLSFYRKKFFLIGLTLIALLSSQLINKFYIWDINTYKFYTWNMNTYKSNIKLDETLDSFTKVHKTDTIGLNQVKTFNLFTIFNDVENLNKFYKKQFVELNKKGIYHSKTFLFFNKIFKDIKINFKLIEIPLNIFNWLLIMLLITYFISKKNNTNQLYFLFFLYTGFIIAYYIFLLYWGGRNRLINDDYSIAISWQRHLGTLILGIILFLLVKFFQLYKSFKIIILLIFLSISVTLPNSIRMLLPTELINKNLFWKEKNNQRQYIKSISYEINKLFKDYTSLILAIDKDDEPYFNQILKYELIKLNIVDIQADNFTIYLQKFIKNNPQEKKLFLITDGQYGLERIEKKIYSVISKHYNDKPIIRISFKLKKTISEIELYEIIIKRI